MPAEAAQPNAEMAIIDGKVGPLGTQGPSDFQHVAEIAWRPRREAKLGRIDF